MVQSSAVRTKNIFKDMLAAIAATLGGDTPYYAHLLNETTEAAMDQLVTRAKVR